MSKGTSQTERQLTALSTEHFNVDERSLADLYREVQLMARAVRFYNRSDEESPQDWSAFFGDIKPLLQKLSGLMPADYSEPKNTPPHLSLMMAFIKLYSHAQKELNNLTGAHLNFFYTKVLGEERKTAIPDKVYVFFELARNIKSHLLPRGALLLDGKDEKGDNIFYTTDEGVFLNHSKISKLHALQRSVLQDGSIYSFPVANSADGFGSTMEEGEGWFPFGDLRNPGKSAEIGFAFVSPMLILKEGKRTIRLSLTLDPDRKVTAETKFMAKDLAVRLTSSGGWITRDVTELVHDKKHIELSVELNAADPPIVHYDKMIHGYSISNADGPMMKVLLQEHFTFSQYGLLSSLRFTKMSVMTEVEGASSLIVRNDYGELDANKAFQPFGFHPVRGSNFYVGLEETFYKPIEKITLVIRWKGLPDNFKTYYEGYRGQTNSLVNKKEDFKVTAAVRFQKKWVDVPNEADKSGEFALFSEDIVLNLRNAPGTKQAVTRDEDGIVRLTLSAPYHAFGHSIYPAEYAKAIIGKLENKEAAIPNEPYTPVAEFIELSYTATDTMGSAQEGRQPFRFFHVKPFGISEIQTWTTSADKRHPLVSGEFYHGGSLFIGIQNLSPPQQLSLFFEIKEVTLTEKPNPRYYYLNDKGWNNLSGNQILSDTTMGLKQTGFLVLNLPDDLTSENTSMEEGHFWIMIAVESQASTFDPIVNIRTNGVTCTLDMKDPYRLEPVKVLPPFSITTLVKKSKEIKKVEQPYSSFGGQATEKEADYFVRISEKLRHKVRGISAWDLERLVLEQFPGIYKVKCIQHADSNGKIQPGVIHIIVIPYIRQYHQSKVLKPFVTSSTLRTIQAYVKKLISPHVKLVVTNADYQEIKVVAQINFNSQVDTGFYIKRMQDDLQFFLSPWTFSAGNDIQLGSTLYRSSIIEFIESRPYVNFISTIRLMTNDTEIEDQVIKLNERAILVSSDKHRIESIGLEASQCQTNQGIEEMIIDINFEVQ